MNSTQCNIRLEVFKKHCNHVLHIIPKERLTYDEAEPVVYYMEQMISLLMEERMALDANMDIDNEYNDILQYCLDENLFNLVYNWSLRLSGDILEKVKLQLLKLFSIVVEQGKSDILLSEHLLQPLLRLIREYSLRSSRKLELGLVHLTKLVIIRAANDVRVNIACMMNPDIKLASLSSHSSPPALLDPLVPFLHRDGILGEQARSAVLLQLTRSEIVDIATEEETAVSVALQSDFCPVLATGLSALYSALPRKLPIVYHTALLGQISPSIVAKYEQLQHFLDYLNFCCQVNQVTHPLIREAVLHYIYNGFLIPVIGASLNQSSMEEVTTATMYLELFLRSITDPGILKAFLCFTVAESHEGFRILDSFINRMNSNTGLAVATMSLLSTMLSFHCEDVMFELVFRHLISLKQLANDQASIKEFVGNNENLESSCGQFLKLQIINGEENKVLDPDYLMYAQERIDRATRHCETSWTYSYSGDGPVNVEKSVSVTQTPFHGFLDHYSQLLEMRDICRRNSTFVKSASDISDSEYERDDEVMCPFSPCSQRSTADTITSMKFDHDSQLDRCLQKLRYPSQEDLREQKSHYMISYNMMDYQDDDDEEEEEEEDELRLNRSSNDNHTRYWNGFDEIRVATPDDSIEEDIVLEESILNIRKYLDCETEENNMDMFQVELSRISLDKSKIRISCNICLNDVLESLTTQIDTSCPQVVDEGRQSVMSMQSAITMEDEGLGPRSGVLHYTGVNNYTITKPTNCTAGNFLYTLLECLESMPTNSYAINLQLSTIVIMLLSYPQPLLRNYLLDTTDLSAQTTTTTTTATATNITKSLYRVLTNVQTRLDNARIKMNIAQKNDNYFNNTCIEAMERLERRRVLLESCDIDSEELANICEMPSAVNGTTLSSDKNQKRQFSLLRFLSGAGRKSAGSNENVSIMKLGARQDLDRTRHINLAYSILVFDDLVHEIAAFARQHSVFVAPSNIHYLMIE